MPAIIKFRSQIKEGLFSKTGKGRGLGSSLTAKNVAIWVKMWLFHASGGCYLRLFWPCGYLGWLLELLRLFGWLWAFVGQCGCFVARASFCWWLLRKCGSFGGCCILCGGLLWLWGCFGLLSVIKKFSEPKYLENFWSQSRLDILTVASLTCSKSPARKRGAIFLWWRWWRTLTVAVKNSSTKRQYHYNMKATTH